MGWGGGQIPSRKTTLCPIKADWGLPTKKHGGTWRCESLPFEISIRETIGKYCQKEQTKGVIS